jgi:hypothetical protein
MTWEIILMKMKKSSRRRHCSKIFKTNLETHISPLLNRPQRCQGCQKNRNNLRITAMIRFATFRRFLLILKAFMQFIQFWLKTSGKTYHGCDPWVFPVLLTPLAPLGAVKYWRYMVWTRKELKIPVCARSKNLRVHCKPLPCTDYRDLPV